MFANEILRGKFIYCILTTKMPFMSQSKYIYEV